MIVAENILELIGKTPMLRIQSPNPSVKIYAKLEGQNIGGSVKDRIALSMVTEAEKRGELTKDKIILEPTSGNTGIGLALVAAAKGYKIVLTMSSGMSQERKTMIRALGAELVETDPAKGTDGAVEKAIELLKENPGKYWMPYQHNNPDNPRAHYNGTAVEILEQVPEITDFVAGMGTTGTLMGVQKRLKEHNPKIRVIGVEPVLNHKVQGLKNMKEAIVPKIFDRSRLDKTIMVKDEAAYETARSMARSGLFIGMSSGAAVWAAQEHAKTLESGTIVVLLPDRGERYLSTPLFSR